MNHKIKGRKLGTDKSHTKAMKRSLVSALFLNDRIKTIESRAKEIRPDVDKIIKWAKRGDLHSRRLAIAYLGGDKYLVQEIFEKVSQGMFKERNSGYTRIVKIGYRKGDNAPMVIIELINEGKKKSNASDSSDNKRRGRSTNKVDTKQSDSNTKNNKENKAEDANKDEKKEESKKDDNKPENKETEKEESKDEKPVEDKKEEK